MCWASRAASAMRVSVGVWLPAVGNTELPATNRLPTPWTRQWVSTTPCFGSSCIRVVPMWCQFHCGVSTSPSTSGISRVSPRMPARLRSSAAISAVRRTVRWSRSVSRQSSLTRLMPRRSRSWVSMTLLSGLGHCSTIRVIRRHLTNRSEHENSPQPKVARLSGDDSTAATCCIGWRGRAPRHRSQNSCLAACVLAASSPLSTSSR